MDVKSKNIFIFCMIVLIFSMFLGFNKCARFKEKPYTKTAQKINSNQQKTYECRPKAGVCDVAEYSSGSLNDCPPDKFLPETTICRPQADLCDAIEYCTGKSPDCPPDGKLSYIKMGENIKIFPKNYPVTGNLTIIWTGKETIIAYIAITGTQEFCKEDKHGIGFGRAQIKNIHYTIMDPISAKEHTVFASEAGGEFYGRRYNAENPVPVFTKDFLSMLWLEYGNIYFAPLKNHFISVENKKKIIKENKSHEVKSFVALSTGNEIGVVWSDLRGENDGRCVLNFSRYSFSGSKKGKDTIVSNSASCKNSFSIAWTGSEYGITWLNKGNSGIYFLRLSASGSKIGKPLKMQDSSMIGEFPSIVWTGNEFAILWVENKGTNRVIYLTRVDSNGDKIGENIRVTDSFEDSFSPALVWTGSEYAMVWLKKLADHNYVYFGRISRSGSRIGDELRITDKNVSPGHPVVVWTGNTFDIAWIDSKGPFYFNRIGCVPK